MMNETATDVSEKKKKKKKEKQDSLCQIWAHHTKTQYLNFYLKHLTIIFSMNEMLENVFNYKMSLE